MKYSLKKATAWNLAGYIYLLIASFVTTPTLIHALGLREFAKYALALGIVAITSSLDLGLSRSTVYHMIQADSDTNRGRVFTSSMLLYLALGTTLAIVIGYVQYPLLGFLVLGSFILAHAMTCPESRGDFAQVNWRNFIVGTANTFGATWIATKGGQAIGIIELLIGATILTAALLYMRSPLSYPTRETMIKLVKYGIGNQLGKIVGQVEGQYAKILFASSPLFLSAYSVGSSLVTRLVGGITQASSALFPHSAASFTKPEFARLYYRIQWGLVVLGTCAFAIYQFVGLRFLSWWLGSGDLTESIHHFLLIFRWYAVLLLMTPVASTVIDAAGKPLITSILGMCALIIEIGMAVVLYPKVGLLAPAYGGLVSLCLMVPVLLVSTERILSSGEK